MRAGFGHVRPQPLLRGAGQERLHRQHRHQHHRLRQGQLPSGACRGPDQIYDHCAAADELRRPARQHLPDALRHLGKCVAIIAISIALNF